MTALLTDNLPLLAGAPNGIKKLRELILELAVRGKLVPQDPSDEPASELLKRIAEEKARLMGGARVKKQKAFVDISAGEKPYTLPAGWEFVRLGDLVDPRRTITYGVLKPGGDTTDGVPLIKAENVQFNLILTEFKSRISPELDEEYKRTRLLGGEVLLTLVGSIGRCAIAPIELAGANLSRSVGMIVPLNGVDKLFMVYAITALINESFILHNCAGTAQKVLNVGTVNDLPYPLPPLAEQHRIVAKVDELMALCDRLEAQQADAESAHAQLVQALLGSLTQAADAEDFAASWQRLAEHFHTLFTTESSIDALKQSLLQLAVMGKLVPQDPSEEPASELLKRIAKEKARLVAEGKIRKTKQLPEITDNDKLASTPNGWESVRFGQVIELISGQHLGPDEYFESIRDGAIPYLTGPADFGETYPRPTRFTNERRATSIKGDILLTVKGAGVGKTNFVDQDEFAISRQLMAIRPIIVDAQFARNMLLSMSAHFHSKSIGIAIPGISREDVLDTLIGIPPLPEQHRIVAKVDQLMALCDQLKTRLTQARQLNEQLATALVEQAVA